MGYDPANLSYFSTAWYFTIIPGNGDTWGNPNNADTGFIQYYDESIAPTVTGGWSNSNMTFPLNVSGSDGDSYRYARLWAAPLIGGPSSDTTGVFREFSFNTETNFLATATYNSGTTWYETDQNPATYTGIIAGIFENNSANTSLNGFYTFNFTVARGSWASDVHAVWRDDNATEYGSVAFFAAPGAANVPEPSGLALAGLALTGLLFARRRLSRKM